MESTTSSAEDLVCQTCGDKGFTNSFVYCVKCLGFVVHRYCLDVIPRTYDEFVSWFCEDCKPVVPNKFVLAKRAPSQPQKEYDISSAQVKPTHPKKKLKKKPKKKQKKKRKTAPVKHVASCPEEATKPDHERVSLTNSLLKEASVLSEHNQITPCELENGVTQKHAALLDICSSPKGSAKGKTNSLLKEALVKSDSGHNQITPCELEEGAIQKQAAQLDNCSPKGSAKRKRKRKASFLAVKRKRHRTGKTVDSIEPSLCDSSCTNAALKGKEGTTPSAEEQRGEIQQAQTDHEKLVSDSSFIEKELDKNDQTQTANQIQHEQGTHYQSAQPVLDHEKLVSDSSFIEKELNKNDQTQTANQMQQEQDTHYQSARSVLDNEKLVSDSSFIEKELNKNDQTQTTNQMQQEQDTHYQSARPVLDHEKFVSDSSFIEKELHKNDQTQTANQMPQEQDMYYQSARPVLNPVWRGSFNIIQTDYDQFEGFVGHLSSKACYKVCKEATMLPSLLCLEMHPKAALWPKSFLESPPSDENVALYFFPGDTKTERAFERLVIDMIDEELAMKATAKNADLLIFTSTVLPRPHWRFQGNYYLWGVFRGKMSSADVAVSNNSNEHGLSENSRNEEVTSGNKILGKVKTLDSGSPQSPLCNFR